MQKKRVKIQTEKVDAFTSCKTYSAFIYTGHKNTSAISKQKYDTYQFVNKLLISEQMPEMNLPIALIGRENKIGARNTWKNMREMVKIGSNLR